MRELCNSEYFGVALSVIAFWIGVKSEKNQSHQFATINYCDCIVVGVLEIFHISYEAYDVGGAIINMFLAPATACLAVAIYSKLDILKKYWLPILVGCVVGSAASMFSVYGMCKLFGLEQSITVSLVPKSVTTPIAVSISEGNGGVVPITVVAVIFTGILGSILAPYLIKIFHVNDSIAAGLAIGHAVMQLVLQKQLKLAKLKVQ